MGSGDPASRLALLCTVLSASACHDSPFSLMVNPAEVWSMNMFASPTCNTDISSICMFRMAKAAYVCIREVTTTESVRRDNSAPQTR